MNFCEYRAVKKYNNEVSLVMEAILHYMSLELDRGRDPMVKEYVNRINNGLLVRRAISRLGLRRHFNKRVSEFIELTQ